MKKPREDKNIEATTPAEEAILLKMDEIEKSFADIKESLQKMATSMLEQKKDINDIKGIKENGPRVIPMSTVHREIETLFSNLILGNKGKLMVSSTASLREKDQQTLDILGERLHALTEAEKHKDRKALISISVTNKALCIVSLIIVLFLTITAGLMVQQRDRKIADLQNSPEFVASKAFHAAEAIGWDYPEDAYAWVIRQLRNGQQDYVERKLEWLTAEASWIDKYKNYLNNKLNGRPIVIIAHEELLRDDMRLFFLRYHFLDDPGIVSVLLYQNGRCIQTTDSRVSTLKEALLYTNQPIWEELK